MLITEENEIWRQPTDELAAIMEVGLLTQMRLNRLLAKVFAGLSRGEFQVQDAVLLLDTQDRMRDIYPRKLFVEDDG